MDWDRFKRALEPLQDHDQHDGLPRYSHADLMHLMDEQYFILDFLTELAEKLGEFKSTKESTSAYPQLGPILTAASIHPFLCLDSKIAKATIQCLQRYSQFDTSSLQSSSATWCIDRIRRLVRSPLTVPSHVESSHMMNVGDTLSPKEDDATQNQIKQIISNINKRFLDGSLTPQIVSGLMDLSLALLEQNATSVLIEVLINCGTILMDTEQKKLYWGNIEQSKPNTHIPDTYYDDYALHFDTTPCIFSGRFVSRLLGNPKDRLWKLYRSWTPELIARVWKHQRHIMEYELLDFFQELATIKSYTSKYQLHKQLERTTMVQLLQNNPHLVSIAHNKVAKWVIRFSDWRLVRMWQHVISLLPTLVETKFSDQKHSSTFTPTYKDVDTILSQDAFTYFPYDLKVAAETLQNSSSEQLFIQHISSQCGTILDKLTIYTYTGTFEDIEVRRNEAWVLALMFPDFLQKCTMCLISWCLNQDVWDSKMDMISSYLGWLMCPSDDDRVDDTVECLKHWIISLKGFHTRQPDDALKVILIHWEEIFSGNILVGMSIASSILISTKEVWDSIHCTLMVNNILGSSSDEINFEATKTKNIFNLNLNNSSVMGDSFDGY
ncbi:hypothetical protein PHYBLDRAFT_162289 [Phycomyces blakesleeanus NRRL 1555(-)]|uniref:Uncharacterized protein n=1 Tax=Phycomyces blakesleeanus (strain ATCC 8743b / DSM 1359 / FGSC 10004 / NBRC 33097 / NRRL 1555) TaxID=763407 RepID=A0A163BAC1_PHYB8|nr:hypothetical protein PHYBLDRAFT_162289 [Phycomyces blakesleeanus NRRL 1555(-)]OAD79211.1 hypothetical protein PHYBLDRAFT_162289 [Phycomyces blakesleeanus NRRL 1555(-)]|eukprot:XP_018297251.1 hypothetical protein PHYBLDRAFT_162289 [Phycomyces blakesleeanus NRRL 1555(-)]